MSRIRTLFTSITLLTTVTPGRSTVSNITRASIVAFVTLMGTLAMPERLDVVQATDCGGSSTNTYNNMLLSGGSGIINLRLTYYTVPSCATYMGEADEQVVSGNVYDYHDSANYNGQTFDQATLKPYDHTTSDVCTGLPHYDTGIWKAHYFTNVQVPYPNHYFVIMAYASSGGSTCAPSRTATVTHSVNY